MIVFVTNSHEDGIGGVFESLEQIDKLSPGETSALEFEVGSLEPVRMWCRDSINGKWKKWFENGKYL